MFGLSKRKKKKRLVDLTKDTNFAELKKRTRIVVIDDNKEEFPFKVLQDDGYSIDHWPDVKELSKLESGYYDIIILDIGGVGLAYDKDNEGVGILKHVKNVNPSQIVVAFSGQSHDSSRIPFFQLADQYIPKPASALVIKESLDDLIKTKLTVGHFWLSLYKMLEGNGFDKEEIDRVEEILVQAITSNNHETFKPDLMQIFRNIDNATTLLSIASKIYLYCSTG